MSIFPPTRASILIANMEGLFISITDWLRCRHDWSILFWVASFALIPILTYLTTARSSDMAVRRRGSMREPPILPYSVPLLGNLLQFFWLRADLFTKITAKYGYETPVRLRLGLYKIYVVSGAAHCKMLFSKETSRCLDTKGLALLVLKNLFGTPSKVMPFYASDDSGINEMPLPGSKVRPEDRIIYFQTKTAHRHLSGSGLVQLTATFLKTFKDQLDNSQINMEWKEFPDLHSFLQCTVLRAAVVAMCGSHLLSQSSTFIEDFWEFANAAPVLISGIPSWLCPKPYRARRRMLDAIKKWHRFAHENSDSTKISIEDPEWEPFFGSKLMRVRQEYTANMEFMDADALAASDLGILFATNTNSVPSITWFIYEICRNKSLLVQVKREVEQCRFDYPREPHSVGLDIKKLCSCPLLQSIYAETLRLRVALFVTRTPQTQDFHLGEWKFPHGVDIVSLSRTAAMDLSIWNAGTIQDPHPLDTFWAERFLIYENDPSSGPLQKERMQQRIQQNPMKNPTKSKPSTAVPTFSMDGVTGSWIPFGAGTKVCPGRHFAKQEIIGALAVMLNDYEIRLQLPRGNEPECDMRYFPFGGLSPTKAIPFSMRRRSSKEKIAWP